MGVRKKKRRAPNRRKKKKRNSRKNRNGRSPASKWKPPAGKALKQLKEDWDHVT